MPEVSRRNFLAMLAAAFSLDPDRLLWRPGAKMYSIPREIIPPDYSILNPTLAEINRITEVYVKRYFADGLFMSSPVFKALNENKYRIDRI